MSITTTTTTTQLATDPNPSPTSPQLARIQFLEPETTKGPWDCNYFAIPSAKSVTHAIKTLHDLRPARSIHIDYSPAGARQIIRHVRADVRESAKDIITAEDAAVEAGKDVLDYGGRRYGMFSLWRPLRKVERDPVAVCDPGTVDFERDLVEHVNKQPISQSMLVTRHEAQSKLFTNSDPNTSTQLPRKQYPRLVSIFGDTGMGKSTIIQNLIRAFSSAEIFDTPIVGTSAEAHQSISGGVHVYADPNTFTTCNPIVYVDCEGLRGSAPLADQISLSMEGLETMPKPQTHSHSTGRVVASKFHKRPPSNAEGGEDVTRTGPSPTSRWKLSTPEPINLSKSWHHVVVEKIYPRFLYIFSDVVCYVTSNSRAAEDDLTRIINWAHKAFGKTINQFSSTTSRLRRSAHLDFDLEMLSRNTSKVLEQLATNYNATIDLKKLSEPTRAYPSNFNTHVLNILSRLQEGTKANAEAVVVQSSIAYIAKCIAGEIVRSPSDRGTSQYLISVYLSKWEEILNEFSMTQCRCEKIYDGLRCMNFGGHFHEKGHQFYLKGSRKIQPGKFESGFSTHIESLCTELSTKLDNFFPTSRAFNLYSWSHGLWNTSVGCGINAIITNRTCLACLTRTPNNLLPCSHLVCDNCADDLQHRQAGGHQDGILSRCPFGCRWEVGSCQIRRKPVEAGVRILSLDGGGVRGIVELMILEEIMRRVGHNIPIQELFDLIIGTSTGGIIALGVFKNRWTVSEAIDEFERLAKLAFSLRSGLMPMIKLPGGSFAAQIICTHIYKSTGIGKALQEAFSQDALLFGGQSTEQDLNKIIVVTTSEEESKPFLLTNYNREWRINDGESDNLRREERPNDEMKTWEAARSTSAAPTYFEPYTHPATKRMYIDGGMERNNPVGIADSERQFIWPTKSQNSRDIIVSVGGGYSSDFDGVSVKKKSSKFSEAIEGTGFGDKLARLKEVLRNTTDCQKKWKEFQDSLGPEAEVLMKCHRINVPYGKGQRLCRLDSVKEMVSTKEEASAFLGGTSDSVSGATQTRTHQELEVVARQLVTSLFYFRLSDISDYNERELQCEGHICCRLSLSCSEQFKSLIRSAPGFRLYEDPSQEHYPIQFPTNEWNLREFTLLVQFRTSQIGAIRIKASFDGGKNWDDISGFPRDLRKPIAACRDGSTKIP